MRLVLSGTLTTVMFRVTSKTMANNPFDCSRCCHILARCLCPQATQASAFCNISVSFPELLPLFVPIRNFLQIPVQVANGPGLFTAHFAFCIAEVQLLHAQEVTPVSEDRPLVARDTDRDALLDEVMVDIADWLASYPLIVLHGSQNLSTVCTNSACTHMSLSSNFSPASSSNITCPPLALSVFTTASILTILHMSRHGGRTILPCFLLETSPTKEESVRCQSVSRKKPATARNDHATQTSWSDCACDDEQVRASGAGDGMRGHRTERARGGR